ncbi:hypothetical protein BVY04_05055 [bacterium M21]|nr:hypothetical protein BVY04_05055 [bacterium M21]
MAFITRPETCVMNVDRRTSELRFPKGHNLAKGNETPPDGEYWMRGGICWPVFSKALEKYQGFAVMLGWHVETRVMYLLAEQSFLSVEHVTNEEGFIEAPGLCRWLNQAWTDFYGDSYYWHQDYETNRKYLLETVRSPTVQPKPRYVEVEWKEDDDAWLTFWQLESQGKVVYSGASEFSRQLGQFNADDEAKHVEYPALYAMMCGVNGVVGAPPRF